MHKLSYAEELLQMQPRARDCAAPTAVGDCGHALRRISVKFAIQDGDGIFWYKYGFCLDSCSESEQN